MKAIRLLLWIGFGLTSLPAHAQFTLGLHPVSPGEAALTFTREFGYYYSLESTPDLTSTFAASSGWLAGDGLPMPWSLHYPVNPSSGGGNPVNSNLDTFSLYPFDNGKTLVT